MIAAVDARALTPELRAAAIDPDPVLRGLATRLLARLDHDAVIPLLELALADTVPSIRLDAARGLARHPGQGAAAQEAQLLGAYAAAQSAEERTALLGLLSDVAVEAWAPVEQALRSELASEQEAGCLAVARLALRHHAPSVPVLEAALNRIAGSPPPVALACLSVLATPVARETLPEGTRGRALQEILAQTRSGDVETVVAAIEALAALGGPEAASSLEALVGSQEPRIALESVRALRGASSSSALAALAERELDRIADPSTPPSAAEARSRVLVELLSALELKPDRPEAAAVAEKALGALLPLPQGSQRHAAIVRGLASCAAARLADAARHGPKALLSCGHGQMPEALRAIWTAQLLAGVQGSDELRAVQLARLLDKGSALAATAALEASSTLPVQHAAPLMHRALASEDPAVVLAGLRAVAARPALRSLEAPAAVRADELLAAGGRASASGEGALAWLEAVRMLAQVSSGAGPGEAINAASGSSSKSRPEVTEIEGILASDPKLIAGVTQLARHPVRSVRERARALLSEWERPVPAEAAPLAPTLAADRVPAAGSVFHVKLVTTAGPITLDLDLVGAPVAAVRFVELARSGALDGLPVADLAAGHAVAFTPAIGDSANWRHEDLAARVERGSVLLQDHGRDLLGPGFALILSRAPALDGRAARLGTVSAGLEIADSLTAADVVLEAQVSTGAR